MPWRLATMCLATALPAAAGPLGVLGIAAREEALVVSVRAPRGRVVRLVELRPYQTYAADAELPVVWEGKVKGATVTVPRYEGRRDRLYSKFQLVDGKTREALGSAHYVTDLSALPARSFDFPWPKSIKGLQVQMVDDAIALGVKYAGINAMVHVVIDCSGKTPEETWEADGERIPINLDYVRQLDAQIKPLTEAGVNVTCILLNGVPSQPVPANPFIHPRTDLANAPNHLGAFNTTDERGLRYYRAVLEYLANRYSDPSAAHGWVSGYIIGNEVQAHWDWYNIGSMPVEDFVGDYGIALRIADLAFRRFHAKIRTYVSLEHHWNVPYRPEPGMGFRGRDFLERLAAWSKAEGDFPWQVAFHPYPENLFEPRTWNDRQAWLTFDTPKITFRNVEVLPAFLRRAGLCFEGQPRRIILSEQGFHTPDGPDGERVQAVGFAYAYYRISHTPSIDAFILHRHVDHKAEGGLKLGLWTWKEDDPGPCTPGRRKFIYEVFRLADTDQWERAFEFAKPIIGITSWDEVLPARTIAETGVVPREGVRVESLVYDLYLNLYQATATNCLDLRPDAVGAGGPAGASIFEHPKARGHADATFEVPLPALKAGRKLTLRFGTALTGPSEDGVRFAVVVHGEEVWSATQREQRTVERAVDLSRKAGSTVKLTLRADALGNERYDWANWVRPQVVVER